MDQEANEWTPSPSAPSRSPSWIQASTPTPSPSARSGGYVDTWMTDFLAAPWRRPVFPGWNPSGACAPGAWSRLLPGGRADSDPVLLLRGFGL